MLGLQEIQAAAALLDGVAHRTPVLHSRLLDERAGGRLRFKMESFQRSGAFKFRGAYCAISRQLPAARERGVITGSSGNHGGAVALAARLLGVPAVVVMPEDASGVKVAAVAAQGAEVVLHGTSSVERIAHAEERAAREGQIMIPPYDHEDIIAGQGTVGLEIVEQVPDVEVVIAPCGGGGLLGGTATAIAALKPGVEVWGVEPTVADDTLRSLQAGHRVQIEHPDTIADGMRNLSPGALTLPLIQSYAAGIVLVDDDAMAEAVALMATRMKVIVEPTGAAPVAAVLRGCVSLRGRTAVAVVSGGNVDPAVLARCLGVGPA